MEFTPFPKMGRLTRDVIVTEKIDGTNASIQILDDFTTFLVGSRTRFITPEKDNMGFARWAYEHKDDLLKLGPGHHFGEWWGQGIQRTYELTEKRFSLFNSFRWTDDVRPACCSVVPVLYTGPFDTVKIDSLLTSLQLEGSAAAPGFMKPEGVVIWHTGANVGFKKTLDGDGAKSRR
jgi:RNA ligase